MPKCVDCMDFITTVLHNENIDKIVFNSPKARKMIKKEGKARVFYCRRSGKVYLNNSRVYDLKSCDDFNDADGIVITIKQDTWEADAVEGVVVR